MGGQAFSENGLVLDMREFNAVRVDTAAKTITVEAGATWHQIQERLHPLLAVKAMQSTDIFTVGGSISVNAHGMDHQVGALMGTLRSMRVVMSDGSLRRVTMASDPELFRLIVGGYGLLGVVAEAELDVTDNDIYRTGRVTIPTDEFPQYFADRILPDPAIGLFYGHLSTAPGEGFLREMLVYTYTEAGPPEADLPPLGAIGLVKLRRLIINMAKEGSLFASAKWFAEKNIDPLFESCTVTRQSAQTDGEACLVSRNEPMHDSVPYLMNALIDQTDILHEYFVPRAALLPFIDAARPILASSGLPILNASVRVVHKEDNFLTYAPEDAFSLVLYVNQLAREEGNRKMAALTSALIDVTIAHGGRFFLPYQLHYTAEQLRASYPMIGEFFAAKRRYDPDGIISNTFYEKYGEAFA
jgi:FAD/FMN-containing dehydrogenase